MQRTTHWLYTYEQHCLTLLCLGLGLASYMLAHNTPTPVVHHTRPASSLPYISVTLDAPTQHLIAHHLPPTEKSTLIYHPLPKTTKVPKQPQSHWAFIAHIGRELILDEAESFIRRAHMLTDAHQHFNQQ